MLASYLGLLALVASAVAQTGNANCDACVNAGQAIANCEQQNANSATPFACICNTNNVLPLLQSCFMCDGVDTGLTQADVQQYIDECKTLSTATFGTGTDAFPLPTDSSAGSTTGSSAATSSPSSSGSASSAATAAASASGSSAATAASTAAATTAAAKSGAANTRAGVSLFMVSVLAMVLF